MALEQKNLIESIRQQLFNLAQLSLTNVNVAGNSATATGPSGDVQGGGIWNGEVPGGPSPVLLTITNATIVHNTVTGGGSITREGGGLYTSVPITTTHTTIARNSPDQCVGC